ncbi:MAG: hypothetical protein R3F49_22440, partial [Planctomycetota bacterium]
MRPQSPRPASLLASLLASLSATLPAALLIGPAVALAPQDEPTREEWAARAIGGWLTLPEDPHGRVFAALGPDTQPAPASLRALAALAPGAAWSDTSLAAWGDSLQRVTRGEGTADDLTTLALLATAQRRADDAWRWLARHGAGAPEPIAGALAYLLPGVPVGTPIGAGGRPGPLPNGALLRPLAPPRPAGQPDWQIAWRNAEFRGLVVGAAEFDGKVVVES